MNEDQLKTLFNASSPLGPIVAARGITSRDYYKALFDEENDLFTQLNHQCSIIVGRKGSGKTTLLNSLYLSNENPIIINLEPADIFSQIVEQVEFVSEGTEFVEQIGRLWEVLLWSLVFVQVNALKPNKDLERFTIGLGLNENQSPYEAIELILRNMANFPPLAKPVPQKIFYTKINNVSFLQARTAATEILQKEGKQAYVLIDSLEDFKFHLNSHAAAISGLLRCIGDFSEFTEHCILRCCIPAERYFDFEHISTNPLKDFRGQMLLHWRSGELVQLAAKRYAKYLALFEPQYYKENIRALSLDKRDHLVRFWEGILPNRIENKNGVIEKPIAYILRHTQLLPRHFLIILSEAISYSIKTDNRAYEISEEAVRFGVEQTEERIQQQIIEAYSTPFRNIRYICENIIKELPTRFNWSDFDSVAAKSKRFLEGISGRTGLIEILAEIGAVGRLVRETDKYFEAVFEYMVPHRLIVSSRDQFCIHPLFTSVYNANANYLGAKPVYTYWSKIVHDSMIDWTE